MAANTHTRSSTKLHRASSNPAVPARSLVFQSGRCRQAASAETLSVARCCGGSEHLELLELDAITERGRDFIQAAVAHIESCESSQVAKVLLAAARLSVCRQKG